MPSRPGRYQVPWVHGNLLWSLVNPWADPATIEWRPNEPFQARLCIEGLPVFQSKATYSWWYDAEGRKYPMLFVELLLALKNGAPVAGGWLSGAWDVRKVGANYSLRYLGA